MNVRELIEKLQQYPPDHRVFVDGYEGGIADVEKISVISVKLNVNEEWYYGAHEEIGDESDYNRRKHGEPDGIGVYLPRDSR